MTYTVSCTSTNLETLSHSVAHKITYLVSFTIRSMSLYSELSFKIISLIPYRVFFKSTAQKYSVVYLDKSTNIRNDGENLEYIFELEFKKEYRILF